MCVGPYRIAGERTRSVDGVTAADSRHPDGRESTRRRDAETTATQRHLPATGRQGLHHVPRRQIQGACRVLR